MRKRKLWNKSGEGVEKLRRKNMGSSHFNNQSLFYCIDFPPKTTTRLCWRTACDSKQNFQSICNVIIVLCAYSLDYIIFIANNMATNIKNNITFHNGCNRGIDQLFFNSKSIYASSILKFASKAYGRKIEKLK